MEKDNCPEKVADDWSGGNEKSIGPLVRFAFEGGPLLVGRDVLRVPDEAK
jgi:hypothetical protein